MKNPTANTFPTAIMPVLPRWSGEGTCGTALGSNALVWRYGR